MEKKISQIVKRDGSIVSFDQEKITVAIYKAGASLGKHDRTVSEQLACEVVERLHKNFSCENIPTVEEIQDIVEEILIKNGHPKVAKAYILYREDRAKHRQQKKEKKAQDFIPYKKLWKILWWNVEHQCETVEKINAHVCNNAKNFVIEGENTYHEDVATAADEILENKDQIQLVIIAGPSCSGKTTTTIKLAEHLKKQGISLVALNIDNYFFDIENQPKDQFGDHDFETPEALDLPLINQHLTELLEYKKVWMPKYDFKTGHRVLNHTPLQLEHNQMVLIDTLHGLYPKMTDSISDKKKFKLYIETLSQIKDKEHNFVRWTDIRLLRRMVRDKTNRNYPPDKTIEHWHYVRRSELKHIIPYIHTVDYIVNGSLCYDLPLLKKYLYSYFPEFVKKYENDPHHQDAYIRAKRILNLLETFETLDETWIPSNSLAREFVGGSCYEY
jgi:uridine kinase